MRIVYIIKELITIILLEAIIMKTKLTILAGILMLSQTAVQAHSYGDEYHGQGKGKASYSDDRNGGSKHHKVKYSPRGDRYQRDQAEVNRYNKREDTSILKEHR